MGFFQDKIFTFLVIFAVRTFKSPLLSTVSWKPFLFRYIFWISETHNWPFLGSQSDIFPNPTASNINQFFESRKFEVTILEIQSEKSWKTLTRTDNLPKRCAGCPWFANLHSNLSAALDQSNQSVIRWIIIWLCLTKTRSYQN